ncbi:MAG TPA: hypothetical protein VNX47_03315 [Nevskia sp.]|nr:hypothetical protein [Nevskia sp.]
MLGLWSAYSQIYLLSLVCITSLVFALPIFLVPLSWARWFGWRIPQETDLAVYFGRCLGAFILIIEALMLRAGLGGVGLVFTFQALLGVAAMMVLVHIWGALRRIQPLSETLEIGMYGGMFLLSVLFYPAGPA